MRYVIAAASMILAIFSAVLDWGRPSPDSWICRQGLCRFDQIVSVISSSEGSSSNLASLVTEDPSNPFAWCVYGDSLALKGESDKASAAFDHAITLGPNMPPVLMRTANFDFTHDRVDHGLLLSNQILRETPAFDEILFSYLTHAGIGMDKLLGTTIPASARPAQSWLRWLGASGSDADVSETWTWMKQNSLVDEKLTADLSWMLWRRQSFHMAQKIWCDWLGSARGDYLNPELLLNRRLQNSPAESPFDWSVSASPSIKMSRDEGLDIRFSGTDNAELMIQQLTSAEAGPYRLSAEIQSRGLTTDQHPFFHIIDAMNPGRLDVRTPQIEENAGRRKIVLNFTVPPGTQALAIQLIRSKSERFDNKIEGTLRVFVVSLLPANYLPK